MKNQGYLTIPTPIIIIKKKNKKIFSSINQKSQGVSGKFYKNSQSPSLSFRCNRAINCAPRRIIPSKWRTLRGPRPRTFFFRKVTPQWLDFATGLIVPLRGFLNYFKWKSISSPCEMRIFIGVIELGVVLSLAFKFHTTEFLKKKKIVKNFHAFCIDVIFTEGFSYNLWNNCCKNFLMRYFFYWNFFWRE